MIYVRCVNCIYNNVAKGIRLLDKKTFLFIQEKFHASKSFCILFVLINTAHKIKLFAKFGVFSAGGG